MKKTRKLMMLALATTAIVYSVGCNSGAEKADAFEDPFFPPRGNAPASETMFKKQYALGAAEDSMLFPVHFDGETLNALGKQKIDAIFAGTSTDVKPNLYLNLNKDDAATGPRQASVEAYLKDENVASDGYAIAIGPNPSALRPAAAGVQALSARRLEQGDASVNATSNNLPVVRE